MTHDLDARLRDALARRADDVPDAATNRLISRATRSRRRWRWPASIGVVTAASAAAVAVALAGPWAGTAYASWNASPTTPTASQVAAAQAACVSAVPTDAAIADASSASGPLGTSGAIYDTTASDWSVVITDVRGAYTLEGLSASTADATNTATCLASNDSSAAPIVIVSARTTPAPGSGGSLQESFASGPAGGGAHPGISSVEGSSAAPTMNATGVSAPSLEASDASASFVVGLAASDVTGVTLHLSDGTDVVATVGNGHYAAWWPSDARALSAVVTSPGGTTAAAFSDGVPPAPGGAVGSGA
jgi:hypothetical protein